MSIAVVQTPNHPLAQVPDRREPLARETGDQVTEPGKPPIPPTKSYTVTGVAGHSPEDLDDFVGATTVSVEGDDQEFRVRGAGRRVGAAVQFHDKEPESGDVDPPVWKIIEQGHGHMVAEPPHVV